MPLEQRAQAARIVGLDRRFGALPGRLSREAAVVGVVGAVGRGGELLPGPEAVLPREADAGIGDRRARGNAGVVGVAQSGDAATETLDRGRVAPSRGCKQ